jgi:predicted  nucleic acid-binding Zn-ribbon protein
LDAAKYDEKLRALERERDEAIRAAEDAEDRIETMKGEVVRKHLARVEPLEKENALLTDKIDRLEAIIAAGDRIARAAATVGEKRTINTLAEEEEDVDEDAVLGAQVPNSNGAVDHNDVVGTVS